MPRKLNYSAIRLFYGMVAGWVAVFPLPAQESPKFLGAKSCATSGCHGGAEDKNRQYIVWSKYDVHHERPYATLTTARSERIAETLKLGAPTQSARCTVCHAPMQTVPADRLAKDIKISDGVQCENCHGPAENWIRSHTRKDYTHADRVHAGMRDLQNLYVRANTCVACHQNVDADILAAGHPELIFELDGQCVTQPKHWQESTNRNGGQAWLVGQSVALREMSWQLAKEKSPSEKQINRWAALAWLLQTPPPPISIPEAIETANRLQERSDSVASKTAHLHSNWEAANTRKLLSITTHIGSTFRDGSASQSLQARRAERLVLALDRLVTALPELDKNEPVQSALKQLFKDAQSLPDFNPAQFADHLAGFQKALPAAP